MKKEEIVEEFGENWTKISPSCGVRLCCEVPCYIEEMKNILNDKLTTFENSIEKAFTTEERG
jgi:hypothetical protein